MGISPLTRLEIQAWEADEAVQLTPWERRTILKLDATFRASLSPADEAGGQPTEQPQR